MEHKKIKFYDTRAIKKIIYEEKIPNDVEMWISSVTLKYIEHNCSSIVQSCLAKLYEEGKLKVIIYRQDFIKQKFSRTLKDHYIYEYGEDDEIKVLASAITLDNNMYPDEVVYVTGSLEMRCLANLYFGNDSIEYI